MTILIATANVREITALQTVLGDDGAKVEVVTSGGRLLEEAKRLEPDILLLDIELAGLDVGPATRVLARHPGTSGSATILLLGENTSPRLMRMMKDLGTFALMPRPLTCAAIRSSFRSAAKFAAEATKTEQRKETRAHPRLVPGCNALLRKQLNCPFHPFGVKVSHFELRSGKLVGDTDLFDVPVYHKAARDGDFVDYNLASITVCPDCFFATNDPNYFDDPDLGEAALPAGANRNAYRLDPATRGKVATSAGLRSLTAHDRLGREPDASFFAHDRSVEAGLIAYELAIMSSRSLYEAAPVRRSVELLRLGNYELRIASILHGLKRDEATVLSHRAAAAEWLERAFIDCKGVGMYKSAYQLVAIYCHLGQERKAFPFLGTLKEQTKLSRRDQEDPAALERYVRRAEAVWADRDHHRAKDSVLQAMAATRQAA